MNTITKALQSSQRDFGIVIKPTLVIVQIFVKELQDDTQNVYLQPGTLLKIIPNIQQDFVDDDDNKQPKKSNNNKNRNENSSYVIIQVLDYYNANPIWENVYKCNKSDIKPIGQDIWPYIIAITDPDDRALFISNTDRIRNCLYMKIGDLVTAWFIEIVYECEILYIGLIPEFGPGYYFGLRLLNYDKGYSPQTDKICKFAENYTKCDANQTLILSAISIFKTTNKELKKKTSSAKDLFCGTINRAKNVLGISTIPNNLPPEGVITRNSSLRNSSSKRNSSIKRYSSLNRQSTNSRKSISPYLLPNNKITKKTTANDFNVGGGGDGNQFSILSKEETEENTISTQNKVMENHNNKSNNNNNQKLSGQTVVAGGVNIPPSTSSSASSIGSTSSYKRSNKSTNTNFPQTNNETTIINQTTSQQHQQQNLNYNSKENVSTIKSRDKSIQIDDNLIQLENEEYARKIENYEKYIEQKNISSISTINSGGQLPVSILKQPKIGQITTNNNSNSSNSSSSTTTTTGTNNNNSFTINHKKKIINNNLNSIVKPNTIMSLEDRDIVIIDKADIKESTKNENSIIVLDNPRKDVDLVDLLGPNWPVTAGDAAQVLNTTTTINDQIMAKNISSGSNTGNGGAHIHSSSSNSSSVSNYSVNKNERNKSGNPLSHMARNISDRRNKENLSKLHQQLHNETGNLDNKPGEKKLKNTEPVYDNTNSISLLQHQKHVLSSEASSSSVDDEQIILPSPLNELPDIPGLGVGSMVEVSTDVCEDLYGVIRWIGFPNSSKTLMVGVELEDDPGEIPLNLTDGALNGKRLFKCPERRAFFIYPNQCSIDRRFLEIEQPISESSNGATGINTNNTNAPIRASSSNTKNIKSSNDTKMFGQVECPSVPGAVPPLKMMTVLELEDICGKFKGIQGHHNSCYLDATLFSMFTFTSVFDSLLFRPPEKEDISHYEEVQKVLREEIVNPLRKNVFVRADRVMKLRQLLEKLSSVSGLTCEEKDPEEFLNSLLAQILRADPFLKLSSGQDTFFYQLFVEKDERLSFPSVQQLFEQSFLASDIKLKEVPSCLIIQMPRFGKNFKMYPRILPSQVLDVTDIIEDSPRQCTVCGKLAEYECRECFGIMQCGVGLESTSFCKKCLETAHSHTKRAKHNPKEISVPEDFKIMAEHLPVPPRLFMELFAVVCIETSHYVSFVKAGAGQDAPWCFFDSMADRKGEQNGYNIPELLTVPDLPQWLSEDGARNIHEAASNDKMLPEHAKRLLCDAYMCMYQSTDVMMYR